MPQNIDVLIVGAGPTGLTLACLCKQLGIKLRIIDKNNGPSITSKAIGLQYRVSEVLASMGIVNRFIERGSSPTPVNIYEGSKTLVRFKFDLPARLSGREAFSPIPIMIPQNETERLLGELLEERGGAVEWNTEFVSFFEQESHVISKLRRYDGSEEEVRSSWLISCEGAHSTIRKQAGISFEGKTYPRSFVLADVEVGWSLPRSENHVWMHKDGSFAALPLPIGDKVWRLFFEVANDIDQSSNEITMEYIEKLMMQRSGYTEARLSNPIWLSEFNINCRMVDRFRSGRVFVAGDAAHIHSPTGGQGITTGIQDATNLAWKIGRVLRGAPEKLLDTYQEERLPKAKEVLAETDRTTTILLSPNPAMRLIRDYGVLPVLRMKSAQRRMFGKLSQLHVNYRGSSLCRNQISGRYRRRLLAGDRAPDVAFQLLNSHKKITLFEMLHDVKPVVLFYIKANETAENCERLINTLASLDILPYLISKRDNHVLLNFEERLIDVFDDYDRLYGLGPNSLCLIRPDGHIGLLQYPSDTTSLKSYLRLICADTSVDEAFLR